MKVSRSDIIQGGLTPIPTDRYTVEVVEANVVTNPANNKVTLRVNAKIVSPPVVEVNGQKYEIAGRRFYFMPNVIDPSVAYGLGQIVGGLEKSEFDMDRITDQGDIDTDLFKSALPGHRMDMILGSKEDFMTRAPNAEEIEAGTPSNSRVDCLDNKGQKISKGYIIVNDRGQSPGWGNVVGPASE
jgi:hypothetical protein